MDYWEKTGGNAFPADDSAYASWSTGMTLRDYFAAKALSNARICTGFASKCQLSAWFGDLSGISGDQICAAQAYQYADAMIKQRKT